MTIFSSYLPCVFSLKRVGWLKSDMGKFVNWHGLGSNPDGGNVSYLPLFGVCTLSLLAV